LVEDLEGIEHLLSSETIELETWSEREISTNVTYTSIFDKLVSKLKYDDEKKKNCGTINFELISVHKFLSHVSADKMVVLTGDESMPLSSYSDSKLQIKFQDYTWNVPVKASFIPCKLTSLGFETPSSTVSY